MPNVGYAPNDNRWETSNAYSGYTKEDYEIVQNRWFNYVRADEDFKRAVLDFFGDYRKDGRRFKPEYRHGEARAYVTCQVRGLW